MRNIFKIGATAAVALVAASGSAFADSAVSGDFGYNVNSHFVSYGADVWGAGDSFFGKATTSSFYGDLAVKATDSLSLTLNVWSDINDNVTSGIGGNLQEIDFNPGIAYTIGDGFSSSLTYGAWSYGGDVEQVLDFGLGYDDSAMWGGGFALNPHVTWHYRLDGNGAQKIGSAVVVSVGPSFPLMDGFALTIPAGMAFFTTNSFQGGTESGLAYGYFGGSLSAPLAFIPATYGAWSANFDLIGYFTDKSMLPGNVKADFVTGSFNVKVGF